jgi:hypothetical protein
MTSFPQTRGEGVESPLPSEIEYKSNSSHRFPTYTARLLRDFDLCVDVRRTTLLAIQMRRATNEADCLPNIHLPECLELWKGDDRREQQPTDHFYQ